MGLSLNFTNWMAPNEREREDDEEGIKEGMKELNALHFFKNSSVELEGAGCKPAF